MEISYLLSLIISITDYFLIVNTFLENIIGGFVMYERIMQLFAEKGLKSAAVERELNWGNGSIQKFRTSSPSISKIIDLAKYLNVSVEYIITGNIDTNSLSETEAHLIDIYKSLSKKNQLRLIERAESLQEIEQD